MVNLSTTRLDTQDGSIFYNTPKSTKTSLFIFWVISICLYIFSLDLTKVLCIYSQDYIVWGVGVGGGILHTHTHTPCEIPVNPPGMAALPFPFSYCRIAPKFDRHLSSTAADMPVKLQSDAIILTSSLDQVVCFCPVVCIFARLCAVSNAPRSWEKREGCDSVSRCIPQ